MTAVNIRWQLFPLSFGHPQGKEWLDIQHMLGLAFNTVEAYVHSDIAVEGSATS